MQLLDGWHMLILKQLKKLMLMFFRKNPHGSSPLEPEFNAFPPIPWLFPPTLFHGNLKAPADDTADQHFHK